MTALLKRGQQWIVFEKTRYYRAEIVDFFDGRVLIKELSQHNATTTVTHAKRSMFTDEDGGYRLAKDMK